MNPAEIILRELREGKIMTRKDLNRAKKSVSKELNLSEIIQNSEVIALMSAEELNNFRDILVKKPSRSISGVSVIAVMSKPGKCPHGKCVMCPAIAGVPESYTGKEPATMRALHNDFNPYEQVFDRLKQYYNVGHVPSKVELIIMGGTFLSFDRKYKEWFVTQCFQALNDYPKKSSKKKGLEDAQKENETSKHRCVALVFETRPDCLDIEEILRFGGTRVEIGVQSMDDKVLKKIERGHGIREVIEATRKIKNAGLKCDYHVMLGLPGSSSDDDFKTFRKLFDDEDFRPDGLKIYPTLLIKGTKLHDWYEKGEYEPVTDEYVIEVLARAKELVPEYVRIKRVMRDIPKTQIFKGPTAGNLRERVWKKMRTKCRCIRCREVGRARLKSVVPELRILTYKASHGIEHFISLNDEKTGALIGFIRLRIYDNNAVVRELHVYGEQVPVGEKGSSYQHKGFGTTLLREAEETTKSNELKELKVLPGVGAREYYRKQGYTEKGHYMVKSIILK